MALSDSLPLSRSVPDARDPICSTVYDTSAAASAVASSGLKASVIIIFHNEPFSTLMRSVHSVLDRTPPHLLKEVILYDDGSDAAARQAYAAAGASGQDPKKAADEAAAAARADLDAYLALLPEKVRLVRNPIRKGIVAARLAAAEAASGDVLVVLDSHVEVGHVWLEPLLLRLQQQPNAVVMPQIDGIDAETFDHIKGGIGCQ